jgi:aspartate racemase
VSRKKIGILGGMGPEATADLFLRIIRATPVEKDQDHVKVIIYSNPQIPDRTEAILNSGPSPVPEMTATAKILEASEADFLIMPCNTAHHFILDVRKAVGIPILDMIELTAKRIVNVYPEASRIGLMATNGTLKSRIYHQRFEKRGLDILTPSNDGQREVVEGIYHHVKTGDLEGGRKILLRIAHDLVESGADILVPGCTEVSLVVKDGDLDVAVVDPLQVLAEEAVALTLDGR